MVIVAFTGYGTPRDREMAREAGFDLHVVKPVDVPRIRRLLEFLDPAE
jgi:CheY-like chemotaxis protein